jgi:hypothetical protein
VQSTARYSIIEKVEHSDNNNNNNNNNERWLLRSKLLRKLNLVHLVKKFSFSLTPSPPISVAL